jgi:hypothetical protein
MALSYLNRTQNDAIKELDATCFTKVNFKDGYTNDTLSAYTPNGVLGGSVAAISDDYLAIQADGTNKPIGLFINDAAGRDWENNQALASNKITIAKGMPSVEVDVYETDDYDGAITYVVGQYLYASAEGFLTNAVSADGTVIGIVTKVPTTASPTLGLDMRI